MDSKSVLIADDDPEIRGLFRIVLEEAGYKVLEAQDGREAMRVLHEEAVHMVLIDLVMPGQEGLETIPQIKAGFPATKIIAISGAFGGMFLTAAQKFGATVVLEKPITPEILLRVVRQVLAD